MLSIGDSIAVVGGVITAAVSFFKLRGDGKPQENGNGALNGKYVLKDVCVVQHNETNRRLVVIEEKLDKLLSR